MYVHCNVLTMRSYCEDTVGGSKRTVLRLHPDLAPVRYCVLPLTKKPEIVALSEQVHARLAEVRGVGVVEMDITGSIGKRYRRADEAGVPHCISVVRHLLRHLLCKYVTCQEMHISQTCVCTVVRY